MAGTERPAGPAAGTLDLMSGADAAPTPPPAAEPGRVRECTVVGVTGAPSCGDVIRRAATLARRSGAELVGVHVAYGRQPPGARAAVLASPRQLPGLLGGRVAPQVAGAVAGRPV